MGRLLAGIVAVAMALSATPSLAQGKLVIWWERGFYTAEDDALLAVVRKYEARTDVQVELVWQAAQEMIPKVMAATPEHRRTSPMPMPCAGGLNLPSRAANPDQPLTLAA